MKTIAIAVAALASTLIAAPAQAALQTCDLEITRQLDGHTARATFQRQQQAGSPVWSRFPSAPDSINLVNFGPPLIVTGAMINAPFQVPNTLLPAPQNIDLQVSVTGWLVHGNYRGPATLSYAGGGQIMHRYWPNSKPPGITGPDYQFWGEIVLQTNQGRWPSPGVGRITCRDVFQNMCPMP